MTDPAQRTARERFPIGTRVRSKDGTREGEVVGHGPHPGAIAIRIHRGPPWVLSHMDLWDAPPELQGGHWWTARWRQP
jgi:hypothetical protein